MNVCVLRANVHIEHTNWIEEHLQYMGLTNLSNKLLLISQIKQQKLRQC